MNREKGIEVSRNAETARLANYFFEQTNKDRNEVPTVPVCLNFTGDTKNLDF